MTYFEDLLDEASISSSLITLERDYDDAVCNKGELDERMFINEEDSLLGSGSLSAGAVNTTGVKVCIVNYLFPFLLLCERLILIMFPSSGSEKLIPWAPLQGHSQVRSPLIGHLQPKRMVLPVLTS